MGVRSQSQATCTSSANWPRSGGLYQHSELLTPTKGEGSAQPAACHFSCSWWTLKEERRRRVKREVGVSREVKKKERSTPQWSVAECPPPLFPPAPHPVPPFSPLSCDPCILKSGRLTSLIKGWCISQWQPPTCTPLHPHPPIHFVISLEVAGGGLLKRRQQCWRLWGGCKMSTAGYQPFFLSFSTSFFFFFTLRLCGPLLLEWNKNHKVLQQFYNTYG